MESILSITNSQKIIVRVESISRFLVFAQEQKNFYQKKKFYGMERLPGELLFSEGTFHQNRLKSSYLKSRINI